jgi:hypothetical protein
MEPPVATNPATSSNLFFGLRSLGKFEKAERELTFRQFMQSPHAPSSIKAAFLGIFSALRNASPEIQDLVQVLRQGANPEPLWNAMGDEADSDLLPPDVLEMLTAGKRPLSSWQAMMKGMERVGGCHPKMMAELGSVYDTK